ncbi:MAG: hypothetical protein LBM70_01895 [Victivallales bacterium]|nr:hypothetical protein [Victivallales bacterium]
MPLESSPLFDPDFYLECYPDIAKSGLDPYYHYCLYGWREDREPSKDFSVHAYLEMNGDVKGKMNPLYHYIKYGKAENRMTVNPNVTPNVKVEISRLKKIKAVGEVTTLSNLLSCHFRSLQPIPYLHVKQNSKEKRLNLVTDDIGKYLLGGVGTALLLASAYAIKNKMTLRIITRTVPADAVNYYSFMKMMKEETPKKVIFYSDYDRDRYGESTLKLEVFENDEFFATSWWSAVAVQNMKLNRKIYYLIQEAETFFYPYGEDHLYCSRLLNKSKNLCFIVNSHWLWDYFKKSFPNVTTHGVYFEPAFPPFLYHPSMEQNKTKHRLFFYSRPTRPRNLYYFGLEVLDMALKRRIIDPSKWEIVFAGDDNAGGVEFSDGTNVTYLGQMNWQDYAKFLGTVDVTLSLMYTPHPSYPPLDTLSSGGVCVTNRFDNKTDNPWCDNIIFCDLDEESLCQGLAQGIALVLDTERRKENFRKNTIPSSWADTFRETIDFMESFR